MKMIQRLFLYRVDGESARPGIDLADERAIDVPPTSTDARLAIGNAAMMGTEQTTNRSVVQSFIVFAFHVLLQRISLMI